MEDVMPSLVKFRFLSIIVVALTAAANPIQARPQSKNAPLAPVPPQILTAKTVFISNAGMDVNPAGTSSEYDGGANRFYNEFYAAMKSWGRFELVPAPADADLVFEIRFTDPTGPANSEGGKQGAPGAQKFRLEILDPKTHIKLWALTEFVEAALLQGNRNKNFDKAMDALVSDVKILAAQPATQ
jgi:hypothetical protein